MSFNHNCMQNSNDFFFISPYVNLEMHMQFSKNKIQSKFEFLTCITDLGNDKKWFIFEIWKFFWRLRGSWPSSVWSIVSHDSNFFRRTDFESWNIRLYFFYGEYLISFNISTSFEVIRWNVVIKYVSVFKIFMRSSNYL